MERALVESCLRSSGRLEVEFCLLAADLLVSVCRSGGLLPSTGRARGAELVRVTERFRFLATERDGVELCLLSPEPRDGARPLVEVRAVVEGAASLVPLAPVVERLVLSVAPAGGRLISSSSESSS